MNVIEEIHRKLPEHASGDAWFILGAAGAAGHHQRQWRQDEADLGRAGFRDPARHQDGVRKINIDTDNRMAMTDRSERC